MAGWRHGDSDRNVPPHFLARVTEWVLAGRNRSAPLAKASRLQREFRLRIGRSGVPISGLRMHPIGIPGASFGAFVNHQKEEAQ
jgi:hypothetical protein